MSDHHYLSAGSQAKPELHNDKDDNNIVSNLDWFSTLSLFQNIFHLRTVGFILSHCGQSGKSGNVIVLEMSIQNLIVSFCHFTQIKLQLEMKTIKVCHFLPGEIEIK